MKIERYRRALVLGLGRSGMAAAELLRQEGADVTVVDAQDTAEIRLRAAHIEKQGGRAILGLAPSDVPAVTENFDICVVSPGIRSDGQWVQSVEEAGIEVISELELGASRCHCGIVAFTGSKGKSTAVKLCGESLARGGARIALGGNYGVALCEIAGRTAELDWAVVEVSSFQLERVRAFRPRVGVLLNIQPDHLDRHGDIQSYAKTKMKLFRQMAKHDVGVLPEDKAAQMKLLIGNDASRRGVDWLSFGVSPESDFQFVDNKIQFRNQADSIGSKTGTIDLDGTLFANAVLGPAAAAVAAAVTACGAASHLVEAAAKVFEPLPHRMSDLGVVRGVRFVNDSKATSLAALQAALQMTAGTVRLIAGGLLKEHDLESVKEMLEMKASTIYLIGRAAEEMNAAWGNSLKCCRCGQLEKAVRQAFAEAKAGETVLLSPGCASFDQFRDFEDRGEQFTDIVRRLQEEYDDD